MNNGMDDNVPDVCKICGYIISPEEDAPEEICEKCQQENIITAAFFETIAHYKSSPMAGAKTTVYALEGLLTRIEQDVVNYQNNIGQCTRCHVRLSKRTLYRCFDCHMPFCWRCIHEHCNVPLTPQAESDYANYIVTGNGRR